MNTIIEKIRAEVERMKNDSVHLHTYDELLFFLSDLEKECEEKPIDIDFEQELYKHFGQVKDFTLGMQIGKYFYELGKQEKPKDQWSEEDEEMLERCCSAVTSSDYFFTYDERCAMEDWLKSFHLKVKSEKPSEGLEEEIYNYANTIAEGTPLFEIIPQTARHFAQWQKEQMMKEAVECVVYAGMEGDKWIMTYIGSYESMLKTCKAGDKVRIIICKKED